jgi:signal transduction histidine kinase
MERHPADNGGDTGRQTGIYWPETAFLSRRDDDVAGPDVVLRQTFEKVERAKQEWETTMDSLPELICLINSQGRVLRANRTVERWRLGRITAIRGRSLHELIHPNCGEPECEIAAFLANSLRSSMPVPPAELEIYDQPLKRHIRIRIQPVPNHRSGSTQTTVVIIQDISEQKQMAVALQRYTNRLETMNRIGEAILAAHSPEEIAQAALVRIRQLVPFHQARVALYDDESSRFVVLAAEANGEIHLKPDELLPLAAFKGSQEREPDRYFVVNDILQLKDPLPVERALVGAGTRSYINVPLVSEGEFIGSFSLGVAVPGAFGREQVAVIREVADLLAISTHQAQLYCRLQRTNQRLNEALLARAEMIQNVSHELRTPLALARGYTELLQEEALGPLNEEQKTALGILHDSNRQLHYMVNRLLILQTLDKKTIRPVPLDLAATMRQAEKTWLPRAMPRDLHLQFDLASDLPVLLADNELIDQVIYNLLDNAVKFSPAGASIAVRVRRSSEQEVTIAVSDQGIGIPAEKLNQIFDRFYQVNGSSTRQFGGMGIGLALCRKIVEVHDGRLWAESRGENQGSTFFVSLPVLDLDILE